MANAEQRSASSAFVTSRPVAVLMVCLAACVFGYFSYQLLPLTLMPELSYPTLTVRTEYPGAAPEEVENDVTRPLEEALGVIGGLRRLSSVSRAGVSDVVLELAWDTEVTEATQDCLEKLDLVQLPTEASRPRILHYDPALDPIMELSLAAAGGDGAADDDFEGEEGLRRLRRIAELQVKRLLEPIAGVAAVRIEGGLEEEIHVLLDADQLRRTGLSIRRVIDRLGEENINVAGGNLTEGRTEYMVRTLNEFVDPSEIAATVVATVGGREVRVGDLAQVVRAHKDRQIVTRSDGGESVQISIYKEADANIVALAKRVKAVVGEADSAADPAPAAAGKTDEPLRTLAASLLRQEGVRLQVVADRSIFIESSINEVKNTALFGGLLAIAILYLFLADLRATAIIAVSIPISIVISFAPLHGFDVSLNIMSLGGLALGIGMLVDSSIVVLESVFRCREEGDSVVAAAIRGTDEVRGAVFASILTTIAVFFPMVFVEGIAGQAFGDLGLAVVISLLASLAVALYFIPMLASREGLRLAAAAPWRAFRGSPAYQRFAADIGQHVWFAPYLIVRFVIGLVFELIGYLGLLFLLLLVGIALVARLFYRLLHWAMLRHLVAWSKASLDAVTRVYAPVIRLSLANPGSVTTLVILALVATAWMGMRLDSELLPEVHQGEFTFEVGLPVGTPIESTERALAPVEHAIMSERDHIRAVILTVGYDAANTQRSDEGEHTARVKVLLEPIGRDRAVEQHVIDRIREKLRAIPDLEARITRPVLFSSRTPIEVEVHGDDLSQLRQKADEVRAVMARMPGLADVESTQKAGAPEVRIVYDRDRLSAYGLSISEVAAMVKDGVKGAEATRYNRRDRRVPVIVRLDAAARETVNDLAALTVNPGSDRPITLGSVASVALGEGPSEVRRVDRRRVALVRANIAKGSLGSVSARIQSELETKVDWPNQLSFYLAGQNDEWQRSRLSLLKALGLSVFLVYVIMAAQFESLVQPLVIMFTIPLALFGAVAALYGLGISLSVVVFLGMILLAGIVVNNAIVLVDYVNTLRARGLDLEQALVTAGTVRLRPILLTTATTVLGLLPMALGLGDGAEIRTPMAITVIAGLTSSTLLTLIVIPTAYAVVARLGVRLFPHPTPENMASAVDPRS